MQFRPALALLSVTLGCPTTELGLAQGARLLGPSETYSPPRTSEHPRPGPQGSVNFGPTNRASSRGPDLAQWDFWWGTNGPDLLESARASETERPTPETLTTVVVPALIEASRASSSPSVKSAALLALAKLGDHFDTASRTEHLLHCMEQLASDSPQVTETAVLALGVLGNERAVPLLAALMHDDPRGRRATLGSTVHSRTRANAAYSLGLIAERGVSNDVRRAIAAHLIQVLEEPNEQSSQSTSDLKVGAMDALGLVRLAWPLSSSVPHVGVYADHVADRCSLLAYLVDYMDPERERAHAKTRHWFVRAHAPLAVARLLRGDTTRADVLPPEAADAYGSAVSVLLRMCSENSNERTGNRQSALIALGLVAAAPDSFSPEALRAELDAPMCARLIETATNASDNQAEYFALIALAEAGGQDSGSPPDAVVRRPVQAQLLSLAARAKGSKGPWSSLALGVHGRAVLARGGTLDGALASALRTSFNQDKTPQTTGAHALALAFIDDSQSAVDLLRRFEHEFKGSAATCAQLAQALGLLDARDALEPIKAFVDRSRKYAASPTTEAQHAQAHWAAVALAAPAVGRLGGRGEVPYLVHLLSVSMDEVSRGGAAIALGLLGDTSALGPLVDILRDAEAPEGARAAAAIALGLVCDTAGRPWNVSYLCHANYRVNTFCLDDEAGHGLFELL